MLLNPPDKPTYPHANRVSNLTLFSETCFFRILYYPILAISAILCVNASLIGYNPLSRFTELPKIRSKINVSIYKPHNKSGLYEFMNLLCILSWCISVIGTVDIPGEGSSIFLTKLKLLNPDTMEAYEGYQ